MLHSVRSRRGYVRQLGSSEITCREIDVITRDRPQIPFAQAGAVAQASAEGDYSKRGLASAAVSYRRTAPHPHM